MVDVAGPDWSDGIDRSTARGGSEIASGPSPVLLPPDGPRDLVRQLHEDVETLRRYRLEVPGEPDSRDWVGAPIYRVRAWSAEIVSQLAPIRTRATLTHSYQREAVHPPAVRLAYALLWLALGQAGAPAMVQRRRSRRTAVLSR